MYYYAIDDGAGTIINKRATSEELSGSRITEITEEEYENLNVGADLLLAELRANLSGTDYVACKIAEGAATREEYAAILSKRAAWRAEINKYLGEV